MRKLTEETSRRYDVVKSGRIRERERNLGQAKVDEQTRHGSVSSLKGVRLDFNSVGCLKLTHNRRPASNAVLRTPTPVDDLGKQASFTSSSPIRSYMEQDETGCQFPEGPILCVNNCGFFGSATTMNMCSKCHKDMIRKQDQAKLAASSIFGIVNCSSSTGDREKEPAIVEASNVLTSAMVEKVMVPQLEVGASGEGRYKKPKEGPS